MAEQPLALVTFTVNEPELLTVIDCVTALLFHKYEEPADDVSTTEPPVQKVVGPPAEIVAVGSAFCVIVAEFPPFVLLGQLDPDL